MPATSLVLSLALLAPAAAAQETAEAADRLEEELPADPGDAPEPEPLVPEAAPEPERPAPPPIATVEEIKSLARADPRFARPVLRRAARSAPDDGRRALGLVMLARMDPTRATARICARALRIDDSAKVRRAAAECLGRLPPAASGPQTPALVAALSPDEALDVRTMAGWAIANVGGSAALPDVTALADNDDPRVARLFYEYTLRLRTRHGMDLVDRTTPRDAPRLVPPGDALIAQQTGLETAASTAWLALYGGMSGWLHGGFFPAAHGGAGFQQVAALTALAGGVGGVAIGGAYGFFRADRLKLSHTVVQLGTAGTVAGYGLGLLSGVGPEAGINMASFGLSGALVGTTVGVLMTETLQPTPGALALGLAAGLGSAYSFGSLALGYSLVNESFVGITMLTGGAVAALTTAVAAPYDFGLLPLAGATVGGLTLGTLSGLTLVVVEGAQLGGQVQPFTPGAGWAAAGGYVVGAVLGAGATYFVPEELDPFHVMGVDLTSSGVGAVADLKTPGRAIPVAQIAGTF